MKILDVFFVFKTLGCLCTVELDEGRLMAELDAEGRDLEEAGLRIVLEEVARNRGLSWPK